MNRLCDGFHRETGVRLIYVSLNPNLDTTLDSVASVCNNPDRFEKYAARALIAN